MLKSTADKILETAKQALSGNPMYTAKISSGNNSASGSDSSYTGYFDDIFDESSGREPEKTVQEKVKEQQEKNKTFIQALGNTPYAQQAGSFFQPASGYGAMSQTKQFAEKQAADENARREKAAADQKEKLAKSAAEAQENLRKDNVTLKVAVSQLNKLSESEKNAFQQWKTLEDEKGWQTWDGSEKPKEVQDLENKYGAQRLQIWREAETRQQNKDSAEKLNALGRKTAELDQDANVPANAFKKVGAEGLAVAGSVAGGIGSGIEGLFQAGQRLGNAISGKKNAFNTLDSYAGSKYTAFSSGVRQQNPEETNNRDAPAWLKAAAPTGYQGVASALDNSARTLATGGMGALSLGLAGLSSFGSAISEASANGATPQQAIANGIVQGGLEVLTEKIPTDNLLAAVKSGNKEWQKLVVDVLKAQISEITEEEVSLIVGSLAEYAILQGASDRGSTINALLQDNPAMTYEQAKQEADRELLGEAIQTAIQTAISTGVSQTAGRVYGELSGKAEAQRQYEAEQKQALTDANARNVQDLYYQNRQNFNEANGNVQNENATADNLSPVSNTEAAPKTAVDTAVDLQKENGKISNSQAETIIADAEAMNQLGIDPNGKTKSELRAEVKAAIESLANPQAETEQTKIDPVQAAVDIAIKNQNADNQQTDSVPDNQAAVDYALQSTFGNQNQENAVTETQQTQNQQQQQEQQQETAENPQLQREQKTSKVYSNTYGNATDENIKAIGIESIEQNPDVAKYTPVSEAQSHESAEARTDTPEKIIAEADSLISKNGWSGSDNDTAMKTLDYLRKNGDSKRFMELASKQREQATQAGQLAQSFAKYSRVTPESAAIEAATIIQDMGETDIDKKFFKNQGFENWKTDVVDTVLDLSNQIDGVKDGDTATMKDIIRQIAQFRNTTAWFGYSNKLTPAAENILKSIDDFDFLKDIVSRQIATIPRDFEKRTKGEIVKAVRMKSMLFSIPTTVSNLAGNGEVYLLDTLSDSTSGKLADMIMSNVTGKRTIGSEGVWDKTYRDAALDAAKKASLCVELDVPMESETKYSSGDTRTFSPKSNFVGRWYSAMEKYMKYGLEVTDTLAQSGTSESIKNSLSKLGQKSGLSDSEMQSISEYVGNRRVYKEGRKAAQAAVGMKKALNEVGIGDYVMPFAAVPTEAAQVKADYAGAGLVEGVKEMLDICRDVKAGKEIDVTRQRKACSDFGRGMTGVATIALFTALCAKGFIEVHEDKDRDKEGLEKATGKFDAQINLSKLYRWFTGEKDDGLDDDLRVSMPQFGIAYSQAYIGYMISQEGLESYPKASFTGIMDATLDMPMMQNISDLADIVDAAKQVSEDGDMEAVPNAVGNFVGNMASSFIPAPVGQLANVVDPYYRDTTGKDWIESAKNKVVSKIPYLSQTLPKKYSGTGNEQRRYAEGSELLGAYDQFITPSMYTRGTQDATAEFIDSVFQNVKDVDGAKAIYPDYLAPGKFKVNGEDFILSGKEDTEKYQKTYGDSISQYYRAIQNNKYFDTLSPEEQVAVLKTAKQYAAQLAKSSVSDYKSKVPEGTPEEIAQKLIIDKRISSIDSVFDDVTEAWNSKNNAAAKEYYSDLDNFYKSTKDNGNVSDLIEGSDGTVKKYLNAREAGISTDKFMDALHVYKKVMSDENLKDSKKEQANAIASGIDLLVEKDRITESEADVLREEFKVYNFNVQTTNQYEELKNKYGYNSQDARYYADQIAKTGKRLSDTLGDDPKVADWYGGIIQDNPNASDDELIAMLQAVTTNYNPDAKSVTTSELKIDHMYYVWGMSPEQIYTAQKIWNSDLTSKQKRSQLNSMHSGLYNLYNGKMKKTIIGEYDSGTFKKG